MTTWHPVMQLDQLQPGEVQAVAVAGVDLVLARQSDGSVYALADLCTHQDVALSDGELLDDAIECWKHASRFDLKTGAALNLPAVKPVKVYPVNIDHTNGAIMVAL